MSAALLIRRLARPSTLQKSAPSPVLDFLAPSIVSWRQPARPAAPIHSAAGSIGGPADPSPAGAVPASSNAPDRPPKAGNASPKPPTQALTREQRDFLDSAVRH